MIYLLNLKVSGIKNIKDEISIDFYKKTIDKSFDPSEYRIKAIYGENGSGKSAIMTSVKILKDVVIRGSYLSETGTQFFLDELINKITKEFKITCEFIIDYDDFNLIYEYSFTLGKGLNGNYELIHESLKNRSAKYANSKFQTIYEIQNGEIISLKSNKEEKELLTRKTLNLLSKSTMLHLYLDVVGIDKNEPISNDMDVIFPHVLWSLILVVSLKVHLNTEDQHELYFIKKIVREAGWDKASENELIKERVDMYASVNEKEILKEDYDDYEEKVQRLTGFIKIFKQDLTNIEIEKKDNGESFLCELILNYGDYKINKEFESTGIKKLIDLYDCFSMASKSGIVFIDEMDSNLNDIYLCKLIEFFMYYGKGQLCFTTHNLDPMSVLKNNKYSIDFLSSDNHVVPWVKNGNFTPDNSYRNGMIKYSPFNVDASDFIGMFGE